MSHLFLLPQGKSPTHTLMSSVITLMKAYCPSLRSWFLPPLSSQSSLLIVCRGNGSALQLALTAFSISSAKFWAPGHRLTLQIQCQAPGLARNRSTTKVSGSTNKWRLHNNPKWPAWSLAFHETWLLQAEGWLMLWASSCAFFILHNGLFLSCILLIWVMKFIIY